MINLTQDSHTKSESAILKPKKLHDGQDHFFAPLLLDYPYTPRVHHLNHIFLEPNYTFEG